MRNRIVGMLLAAATLAAVPSAPAGAWVAAYGGYRGGVAVARPPCCYHAGYSGATVAGAAVAGAVVGAAVTSAARPAPAPVYVAPPVAYVPPMGTVVYTLPGGCGSVFINGISYMQCGGAYYQPFYSGGTLVYQVAVP